VRRRTQSTNPRTTHDKGRLALMCVGASTGISILELGLPKHPDEHGPERPVLLAVDQELGEGAAL